MSTSKPIQFALLGIFMLIGSVKILPTCDWCSVALVVLALLMFALAVYWQIEKKRKIKKINDKFS